MLIQSLEQKTRLALMTVLLTVIGSVVVCGLTVFYCTRLVAQERSQIVRYTFSTVTFPSLPSAACRKPTS